MHSPAIYGLWKPRIYLPEDVITITDTQQLTHILLHELVHYKRGDLWANAGWLLSIGIHWYNPLIWIAAKQMRADQEVACDARVLEVLGEEESKAYGMTLLMLSRLFRHHHTPRMNLSTFWGSKNETKRRVLMISHFKKGSYRLSIITIMIVLGVGAFLLANAPAPASSQQQKSATSSGKVALASFKVDQDDDPSEFKWFNSLDRARDFTTFDFKVPDYVPKDYKFYSIGLIKYYDEGPHGQPIDTASLSFDSRDDKKNYEVVAASGPGNMNHYGIIWGAHSEGEDVQDGATYQQQDMMVAHVNGTLYTETHTNKSTSTSFVWQDNGISYVVNYLNHTLSTEELGHIVQSITVPAQIRHVSYDGEGKPFPIYDEKDLNEAKKLLGFDMKFAVNSDDKSLRLTSSTLVRPNSPLSTSIGEHVDTLRNDYDAFKGSTFINDGRISLYQSKERLVDPAKVTHGRSFKMNDIEVASYTDEDHQYFKNPENINGRTILQTIYTWKQKNVYYTAIVALNNNDKIDTYLKDLILAPAV